MAKMTSDDLLKVIAELNGIAKAAGMDLDYRLGGALRVDELGLELGFNNRDCNGVCSSNCSGCSGCSGCSTTSTSSSILDPGAPIGDPNPISQFMSDLKHPAVQEFLARASQQAARGS